MKNKFSKFVNTKRLKAARILNGLTGEDMGEKLNKTKMSYLNIENGRVEPKISDIIAISSILGNNIDYFFNFEVKIDFTKTA